MSLISVTKSCRKHNQEAMRLRHDMDEVENMRCAEHVYLANQKPLSDLGKVPPPGFKMANDDELAEMGLTEEMLHPKDPKHFKAEVYVKDPEVWGPNPKPRCVLAFRGSTPELSDWQNNFNQDAGKDAPYYRQAVKIGNRLAKAGADIHLVGHSLGGGLASAAQGGSGLSASTYNAAGLHPETVARYSLDKTHIAAETSRITAIRVKGEVLTRTQESIWGSKGLSLLANNAVGAKRDLAASHDEAHFRKLKSDHKVEAGDDYATYLHGMGEVIDSMEMQKKADQETLTKCRAYPGQCP